ncbi:hypothetical protein C0J52_26304 [Blattella germanica]|nr:hypothetical protein C0J52_26304 [Blattella germanica]
MKYLRKAVNKTRRDRIRNERIREEVGQGSLEEKIEQKQLKWWGHAFRMTEDSKVKQMLETCFKPYRWFFRIVMESRKVLIAISLMKFIKIELTTELDELTEGSPDERKKNPPCGGRTQVSKVEGSEAAAPPSTLPCAMLVTRPGETLITDNHQENNLTNLTMKTLATYKDKRLVIRYGILLWGSSPRVKEILLLQKKLARQYQILCEVLCNREPRSQSVIHISYRIQDGGCCFLEGCGCERNADEWYILWRSSQQKSGEWLAICGIIFYDSSDFVLVYRRDNAIIDSYLECSSNLRLSTKKASLEPLNVRLNVVLGHSIHKTSDIMGRRSFIKQKRLRIFDLHENCATPKQIISEWEIKKNGPYKDTDYNKK